MSSSVIYVCDLPPRRVTLPKGCRAAARRETPAATLLASESMSHEQTAYCSPKAAPCVKSQRQENRDKQAFSHAPQVATIPGKCGIKHDILVSLAEPFVIQYFLLYWETNKREQNKCYVTLDKSTLAINELLGSNDPIAGLYIYTALDKPNL